jgi:hypothetical protein
MRVSLRYAVSVTTGSSLEHSGLELPLTIDLDDGVSLAFEQAVGRFEYHGPVVLEASAPVDPVGLTVATLPGIDRSPEEGRMPVPFAVVPETAALEERAVDAISAVAFIISVGLSASRMLGYDVLQAEGPDDERLLEELGAWAVLPELSIGQVTRTFHSSVVDAGVVRQLMTRPGVTIFSDSINAMAPVARFRELWRILESAFGLQDGDLTSRLAEYPPAVAMDFDQPELEALRTLRGRASHAASSTGSRELITVERDVLRSLGRLQSLAERVILTKKTWGVRANGVDELLPLASYVTQDGEIRYL